MSDRYSDITSEPAHESMDRRCRHAHRGAGITFWFDGLKIHAYEDETIAAAMIARGQRVLRRTSRRAQPRGMFCGMGVCFECLVRVDGERSALACQTPVREGMRVETLNKGR